MTTVIKRKSKSKEAEESPSSTESFGDKLYSTARAGARIAYTALPTAVYGATSEKLAEIDGFNWFKKLLANVLYRGDIDKLNGLNDYSAKGLGASGGLFMGYLIDRATEKIFPKNKSLRKALQPVGDFALANVINLAAHGADSLESLVKDTMIRTGDVIHNIANTGGSDGEYFANTGIAALTALAAVKGADSILRTGIAQGTVNYVKDISNEFYKFGKFLIRNTVGRAYNLTLGNTNDKYESGRIKNDLKKRAEKEYNKKLEDIDSTKDF